MIPFQALCTAHYARPVCKRQKRLLSESQLDLDLDHRLKRRGDDDFNKTKD